MRLWRDHRQQDGRSLLVFFCDVAGERNEPGRENQSVDFVAVKMKTMLIAIQSSLFWPLRQVSLS